VLRLFRRPADPPIPASDARAEPRTSTSIPATLDSGGARFECTIVDVATGGARVRFHSPDASARPCFGQQLLVTPLNAAPITAILRWAEGPFWGVRFLAPISGDMLTALIAMTGSSMRTRPSRATVGMRAEIRVGTQQHKVWLMNLSGGGAMLKGAPAMTVGDALFLQFNGFRPIAAYVRWVAGDRVGVMFNRLLPIDDARHVAQLCATSPLWLAEIMEQHRASAPRS
jgi:hypothetical protein